MLEAPFQCLFCKKYCVCYGAGPFLGLNRYFSPRPKNSASAPSYTIYYKAIHLKIPTLPALLIMQTNVMSMQNGTKELKISEIEEKALKKGFILQNSYNYEKLSSENNGFHQL